MRKWILVGLLGSSSGLCAAEHGFYVGGGWSAVDADYGPPPSIVQLADASFPEPSISTIELEPLGSQAWRVLAGYRAFDWLAVEADLGEFSGNTRNTGRICVQLPCSSRERGDADFASLAALAIHPRGSVDWFVRAGATRWRLHLTNYNPDGSRILSLRGSDTEFTYGGGVQAHAARVVTRLELQHVKLGAMSANLLTLGVAWTL